MATVVADQMMDALLKGVSDSLKPVAMTVTTISSFKFSFITDPRDFTSWLKQEQQYQLLLGLQKDLNSCHL